MAFLNGFHVGKIYHTWMVWVSLIQSGAGWFMPNNRIFKQPGMRKKQSDHNLDRVGMNMFKTATLIYIII